MATIILTGGGTAGHCTPNLALLPYLKNNFNNIVYVGSKNGIERSLAEQAKLPYYSIPCAKLNRTDFKSNLTMPLKVISGIIAAGNIIDKIKPDVIFSKGGYVAVPVVIAASKRKIPIILHESDFSLGLANKICAKYSKKVLTSFPETAITVKNGEHVGSPIRSSIFNADKKTALKSFGFTGQKPIILITGGSQGAKVINDAVRTALPNLLLKYDILHICGKNNLLPEKTPKGYFQTEYLNNIENAFAVASVCVSRAGSNTLFEILNLKIPTLLIPLPKGVSRGDQILNAEYFQKLGLAHVLYQNALTESSLTLSINAVYANRFNLAENFSKIPIKDASKKIADIISAYAP
jgi:UDP-N-acetylglucosamine--N-acetylmuramyl-(pentapeptide) pyrophosphoryl-undecaprenol N-acetylglucosamine transferase